jgi:hypothetical protein
MDYMDNKGCRIVRIFQKYKLILMTKICTIKRLFFINYSYVTQNGEVSKPQVHLKKLFLGAYIYLGKLIYFKIYINLCFKFIL